MDTIELTAEELQEIEIYSDPVVFSQVVVGMDPRWYQAEVMRDPSRRIVLRMGRQVGKCVVGSTRVIDAKTGQLVTVEELYRRMPDDRGPILTLDDNYKVIKTDCYAVEDNGVKDVFRVTSRLGRSVTLTGNHPLLTVKGWLPVEELKPGDRIAVPRSMPVFGGRTLPDSQVKVLAYLTGDGCVTGPAVKFSTSDELVLSDFTEACQEIGPVRVVQVSEYDYDVRKLDGAGKYNPVTTFLRKHDVFGKSALEKRVPDAIFGLNKRQVSLFLNRLFACDGWACVSSDPGRPHGRPQIGYASSSEQLARDVQHLLLRFGIMANLSERQVKYKDGHRVSWSLYIDRKRDIETFAREIGIFSKELQLEEAYLAAQQIDDRGNHDTIPREIWERVEELRSKKGLSKSKVAGRTSSEDNRRLRYDYAPSREKVAGYAAVLEDEELSNLATSDIYWDEIVSIEYVGRERTYDLSVPETLNFIADDIFVHNTFTMSLIILWYAFTHEDDYVMVAAPYDNHVKKIFQELRRFIKKSDILSASVVKDTQNPHIIQFGNGTTIAGFTSGARSGAKGDSARGQSPGLIVLDEVDRMMDEDLDSIMGARFANPLGVRILMASTPTGRRQKFYNWCVTAQGGRVQVEPGRYANQGWTTFYYPSTVNPNWHIVDPETGMTVEEEIRTSGELSEMGWVHEVLAEFGEETVGVFRKTDINAALTKYRYYTKDQKPKTKAPRTIGVDWDKYGDVGTNIVVTEYSLSDKKFKVIYREEIARSEWTFDNAVNRIIKLNEIYEPDWIYIDRGAGDYQYEALRKYGKDHPETGLMDKVVAVHFSEKREIRDPVSKTIDRKPVKPFMVNQTATLLERGRILLNENDDVIIRQFNNYSVVKITASGEPKYTSVDEHILDAFMLSILAFAEKMPEYTLTLYSYKPATKIAGVSMARRQEAHAHATYGAPDHILKDPYELYDWKLKNNKRLVQNARQRRFSGSFSRSLSPGGSTRRLF